MQPPCATLASAAFVSDVHLSADDPATAASFLGCVRALAGRVEALIVLGDLFDAWVGDDDASEPLATQVHDAFGRLAAGGMQVLMMRGNRDFLLGVPLPQGAAGEAPDASAGTGFPAACGARMLSDPAVITVASSRIAIAHGDALCTDDADYQQWRALVRTADWQHAFLARPLPERRRTAVALRARSESAKRDKPEPIMDVSAEAVATLIRAERVTRLVHGHTHRPARHRLRVDGTDCERWVLPDWHAAAGRGGALLVDAQGWQQTDARGRPLDGPFSRPSG